MQNMTTGNIKKLMLTFAIPIFCSQLFQQLYNTADSIIVGQFLGTDSLAAVTSSGNLIFLIVSFFNGAAMGAGVLIGKCFGAGDHDAVNRAVHTQVALCLASGLMITVFGLIFTPKLLVLINVDPEILGEAVSYFRCYFAGSLAFTMYNCFTSIMTAVGDSKRPLKYLIISSCTNIVLDLLFIGVFKWGTWSAAFATILAQGLSALLCIIYLAKPGKIISIRLKDIRFHKNEFLLMLKYGLPSGVQNSVIGLANVIVQSQINSFMKVATATFGVYAKIEGFVFIPIMSFNMAITTFISQNLGAKLYDRAKKGARFGIIMGVVMAGIFGIIYFLLQEPLFRLFTDSADVIALGKIQVSIIVPFYFLLAFSHSIASVCRGAGKAIVPMFVMLGVWCVIRIIYIITVMHLFGEIQYIYWAYPLTWAISSIIYLIYYLTSDWIHGFEKGKLERAHV